MPLMNLPTEIQSLILESVDMEDLTQLFYTTPRLHDLILYECRHRLNTQRTVIDLLLGRNDKVLMLFHRQALKEHESTRTKIESCLSTSAEASKIQPFEETILFWKAITLAMNRGSYLENFILSNELEPQGEVSDDEEDNPDWLYYSVC